MDSLTFPGAIKNYNKGSFNWNFDNGETSLSSCPKFIYYQIGNYTVSVHYKDSVANIDEHVEKTYVVLKHPLTPDVYATAFTIEPNPGTGIFTIIANNNATIDELEVTDATGKLCLKEVSLKENIFNITSLASGVYFVKILSNGLIYNRKVIKY